ncbi:MAG: TonB-dependent receptor [Syntrophales bacterium]
MNTVSRLFVILILFWIIIGWGGGAAATSEDEDQEKAIVMEEIVVTATKTPEMRKDVPNAVIIIDKKDMQASGAKTVGEALANEPGIYWDTYGNYGAAAEEIHIRGMGGDATQVLVNGVPYNSPSLGIADVSKIPIENIERIEVVKGSGSLLYGSGAMGGTVNIITKEPNREKMDLKVTAGYGTQNTYHVAAEQGMFVTKDFGYYLTVGRTETDGFRDNGYNRQYDASMKLVFDKKEVINISLYGDYLNRSYGLPNVKPPAGTQPYYIGGVEFYNSESAALLDNGSDKDGHVVLDVKGTPSKWFDYHVKGYYTHMDNFTYQRYAFDGTGQESSVINDVLGTDGHVDIYPLEGAKLLLGGEYKDFSWKNNSYNLDTSGSATGPETSTEAHMFSSGLFTEAEYRPSQYGKVLIGIRREDNSAFGSVALPLYGLVINPFETTALKINYGKHFLAPTPNDLYWPAGPYEKGNPNLQPEIGWHTDVTLEQSLLANKIFVTASYFHWNVDNKIEWEPDSQGVFSPINLAGYKADGIEVGTKIGAFYDLTLSLNFTWTDAKETDREYTEQNYGPPSVFIYSMVTRRATMTPEYLFKTNLTYKNDFGLTVSVTERYVGDQLVYNTQTTAYPFTQTVPYTIGSYWTTDVKVDQRLYNHFTLSLSCRNLFDAKYDTQLGSFTNQTTGQTVLSGYPGAGRSFFGSVAYEF